MSTDTTKEEAIFDAAIQIEDATARDAYLRDACGDDAALRAAVADLLRFHDTQGDVLAKPVIELGRTGDGAAEEQPGAVIGRYRILHRIAEGGFGAVYRAEQLEPVRREVALKIVKPGIGSHEVIARFEAERQALAMMRHPHIATVLDAGTTASGRPYFVMELVDGQPIDAFCDSTQLPVPDRLQLFLAVCRAVQHAHQKGIVHRDLKPTNVLVVADAAEGRGMPKVIDFGIAKVLHQQSATSLTGDLRSLLGTPEYMSPEQVSGGADVDTRADIYALGGVLYRLLTGVSPLDLDRLVPGGLEEICRTIRLVEPLRPSVRLDRITGQSVEACRAASDGDALPNPEAIARKRGTTPGSLRRLLRGDLDWIVMKALEKDRSRRYPTASELAWDVERFLKQEPVTARPQGTVYRLAKFARRHRVAVAAGAVVSLAIIGGGAAATIGFVRAETQRRQAEEHREQAELRRQEAVAQRIAAEQAKERATAESDKAMQVVALLEQLLGAADPDHGHPADYTVRQLLDDFSTSMFDSLSGQPEVEASLRRTVGRAYWRLADLARAGPHLERAFELRRAIHGPQHPLTIASQVDYGRYLVTVSRFDEAMAAVAASLASLGSEPPREDHIWALFVSFRVHSVRGRYAQAEKDIEESVRIARQVYGDRHPTTLWLCGALVYAALESREPARAESMARELIKLQTEVLGTEHSTVSYSHVLLGMALEDQGELAEAERVLRWALDTHRKQFGSDSSFVARAAVPLSNVLRIQRKYSEAESLAREAVAIAEHATVDREFLRVRAYRALASAVRVRDTDEAARLWQMALEAQREIAADSPLLADMLCRHGIGLRARGQLDEAMEAYREALAIVRARPSQYWQPAEVLHEMANALRQHGKTSEAEPLFREAAALGGRQLEHPFVWLDWIDASLELKQREAADEIALRLAQFADDAPNAMTRTAAQLGRAMIYLDEGDPAAAEPLIDSALESLRTARARRAWGRAECLRTQCLILRGKFEEAENTLLYLDRAARAAIPYEVDDVILVTNQLVKLYEAWNKPDSVTYWRNRPPTP